jgi:serine/threonine protein phosphatase PrpC
MDMTTFTILVRPAGAVGQDRVRGAAWASGHLFVVCDGAGGTTGGAAAADIVAEHLMRIRPPPSVSIRAFLSEALEDIDRSSVLLASGGMTTAVVAFVGNGTVEGASVGDSEAWLVSESNDVVLTEAQRRKPLVGSGRCATVGFGPVAMRGTLVLGTDGLFKYCPREKLLHFARSADLQEIPELLLRATQLPSGRLQDDFAVLVCRGAA